MWALCCGMQIFASFGVQAPELRISVVTVLGLSYLTAYRILVPRPGIGPSSPALEGGFLTMGPPRKSPHMFLWHNVTLFRYIAK